MIKQSQKHPNGKVHYKLYLGRFQNNIYTVFCYGSEVYDHVEVLLGLKRFSSEKFRRMPTFNNGLPKNQYEVKVDGTKIKFIVERIGV